MSDDPFSDVLQLTEARTVIAGGFRADGRWALRFPAPGEIKFAAIAKGSCWLRIDGLKKPVRGAEGDVCLLPGQRGFVVASDLDATPKPYDRVFGAKPRGALATINSGSEVTVLAGGVALAAASAELLMNVLPPVVHIQGTNPRAAALRWIVEQLLEEQTSTVPGMSIASAQLAQLLFVQILRAHLAGDGALPSGWLRASRDARLAPALQLMHREPGRVWRLGDLAKKAGMSRTSFAVRFKAVAGTAPLEYLAAWRMRLARTTLRDRDAAVSEIATSLGYTSESAFSHAFKRETGVSPRDYRRVERSR